MSTAKDFFNITEDDVQNVRKIFGKTEDDIKQDLKSLKEWMKKKHHLPRTQDDNVMERMFLRNKFRIEQTKTKIENYFTMHGTNPIFFDEMKNHFDAIIEAGKQFKISVSPQLNKNYERVIYCQIFSKDRSPDWKNMFCCAFLMLELQLIHDYGIGERYIMDWSNITMGHYKSMCTELNLLLKALTLHQEAYSGRIIGLEYINAPSYIDMFMSVFKMVFKPKLVSKIRIHSSLEDLYKVVEPDYLPCDIGGKLNETAYYHDKLEKVLKSEKNVILTNLEQMSNETLRLRKPTERNNSDILFGVDGTFKKLNID